MSSYAIKCFENPKHHRFDGYYNIARTVNNSKMRRESSLAARETSKEPKPSSKLKRRKNGHLVNVERKVENIPINILEQQEAKYRSAYRFKQPLQEKMKMIAKCLEKVLSKKQMEQFAKLSKWIQKQFSIRCCLQDHEAEGNMIKAKQLRGFLARILQKEEDLAKQWIFLLSQYTISSGSGVFTSDLIAREMSPKHKFIGFGTLDKKQSQYQFNLQYLQEQITRKDQIIKGLFQKIDKLGSHANIEEKSITFGRCMEMISAKLLKNHNDSSKNYELELSIQKQELEINSLIEQSNLLRNENAKLYNDLNIAEEERERLQKKYKDLNEEFEELVGEKIQIEINESKKTKEFEGVLQRYSQLIGKSKLQIEEIMKEELQQIKNMHQYQKHCIQQELSLIWNLIKDQIQLAVKQMHCQFEDNYERLSQKCFNMERRYKQLQHQFQGIKRTNEKYEESKRNQETAQSNRRKRLKCQHKVFQCRVVSQKKKGQLRVRVFDIYQCKTQTIRPVLSEQIVQTDVEVKKINLFQFKSIEMANYLPRPKLDQQTQTNRAQSCVQIQTQPALRAVGTAQTENPQLQLFSSLINLKTDSYRNDYLSRLVVSRTEEYSWHGNLQRIQYGVQTEEDSFELPIVPNFVISQEVQKTDDEEIDLNSCEIAMMLQEAEDCLQFPEVELVRAEILRYKEEVQKLRTRIAQLQKEKEEENVFNFRL